MKTAITRLPVAIMQAIPMYLSGAGMFLLATALINLYIFTWISC
jgi:hypothetical protein